MSTPKDIFETRIANKTANADLQKKINAVFRFDLSGPQGGTWIVDFKPGTAGVRQAPEQAQCTVGLTDTDFLAMLDGQMDPTRAFMSGKIKVTGEMMLAMKLGQLFQ
ncbi:SCP2 sterol-binding domain-containing protein [Pigmentiphaga aceris]|uniref:SCP2 sterol-binding domain-containing protein n=1 Tax=Pigmentiphaga aceris TaxID=1940612 RepID=A0A5C0B1K5_9BURK|nr:SCP2 sterol-binding domain-containing protein [Pigmentiphaga aceris]QEI06631.1 SCP2 sterol-binding domain-containing protein [Pigmentiphaga aceris]